MLFRLAWRSIWRNRRRTLLTMGAITFAAVVCLFTRSLQIGTYRTTIHTVVTVNTGHMRIEDPAYREQQSLDHSFVPAPGLADSLASRPTVAGVSPRLEASGLVSAGENTRGAVISGVVPGGERGITTLTEKVTEGRWLEEGAGRQALLGTDLAANLDLAVGDTAVVLVQTWFGTLGAQTYRVAGILDTGMPEVDASTLMLPLEDAQRLFNAPGRVTSLVVGLSDPSRIEDLEADLNAAGLPGGLRAYTWRDLMPEMVQMIELDNISGWIILAILVLVVGLGILNTVLMGVLERVRQFGVVLAVGLKPRQLALVIFTEALLMALAALAVGDVLGWGLAEYFGAHPIQLGGAEAAALEELGFSTAMPTYLDLPNFLMVNGFILGITLLASVWPALRAASYEPVEALRHG
ncbi:MAG: FtsX-like permease family protein [bacterium]